VEEVPARRRRGRPRGGTESRANILKTARLRFVQHGYAHVTLRSIAAEAGVDVALISHYFESKRGLFGAAMRLNGNPADIVVDALRGPLETLPERLLKLVVQAWDDPAGGPALLQLARTALHDPHFGRLFQEMAEREIVMRIAERLEGRKARERSAIATSQLAGLVVTRYVLRVEPLASMSTDDLIRVMAPSLRRVLLIPSIRRQGRPENRNGSLG
jgi:AcrR family transcriptional regulator